MNVQQYILPEHFRLQCGFSDHLKIIVHELLHLILQCIAQEILEYRRIHHITVYADQILDLTVLRFMLAHRNHIRRHDMGISQITVCKYLHALLITLRKLT